MKYSLIIFLFISTVLHSQGFIIKYPATDSATYGIPFHTLYDDEVVYSLSSYSTDGFRVDMIRSKTNGEVIQKFNLDTDTLHAFCGYGNRIGDKIQSFALAKSDDNTYMVYRLLDRTLNVEQTEIFWVGTYNFQEAYIYFDNIEMYRTQSTEKHFVLLNLYQQIGQGGRKRYIAMSFDNDGHLIKHKELDYYRDITGILYKDHLELIRYNIVKVTYDDDFNFIKEVGIHKPWSTMTNDTAYYLFNSFIQVGDKNIRLGKTNFGYNIDKPDDSYYLDGRCISEVDHQLNTIGKVNFTQLPMTLESDGTARYSGSLFYRDGYYYTLFEYQDYHLPFPSPNTLYVTKYDMDFNIVEETHFMLNANYRLFMYWVNLSDDLQFSLSGFYWNIDDLKNTVGAYVIGLNLDGSQPPLSTQSDIIKATIKVRGNPATDYLTLATEDVRGNEYEVRLYDLQGRLIRTDRGWSEGSIKIPVTGQASGTYIFQVWYKNKPLVSGKFIKI